MTNVFVAIYEHRHGTDARVFATEANMVCNSCDFTSESHDFEEPT